MSDSTTTSSATSSTLHHHSLHSNHHVLPPTSTPLPHPDPTLYYHKPYTNNDLSGSATPPSHLTLLKPAQLHTWLPATPHHHHEDSSSPFSTSNAEMRYLELNAWDLNPNYTENATRVVLDSRNDTEPINYRPWEKPDTTTSTPTPNSTHSNNTSPPSSNGVKENGGVTTSSLEKSSPPTLTPLQNVFPTFTETFNGQKLPSFQSQFNAFNESNPNQPPPHILEGHHPPPPHPPSSFLPPVTSTPSASTPVARYATPMAPMRDANGFLTPTDQPHIQLFPGQFPQLLAATGPPPTTTSTPINGHHFTPYTNGTHFPVTTTQLQELVPVAPMHTIIHHPAAAAVINKTTDGTTTTIPSLNLNVLDTANHHFHLPNGANGLTLDSPHHVIVKLHQGSFIQDPQHHQQPQQHHQPHPHHTQQQPPPQQQQKPPPQSPQVLNHNHAHPPVNGNGTTTPSTPKRPGKRKKMENGNGINGHNHIDPAQVSSVSSTDQSFKRPNMNGKLTNGGNGVMDPDPGLDKPVKKKRKRCGECIGCQRKDNCGDCAPCRNDKSHQICKQRRCDKLTEKKTPKSKLKQQQAAQQQQQQQQIQAQQQVPPVQMHH